MLRFTATIYVIVVEGFKSNLIDVLLEDGDESSHTVDKHLEGSSISGDH